MSIFIHEAKINTKLSIQRSLLIYHFNTELFFNRLYENLIWIIILSLPILPLFHYPNHITKIGAFLIVFFWVFMRGSLYFLNHLTIIKGKNRTTNGVILMEILKLRYPELKINDSGQHMIRCTKPTGLLTWGKQLTVIFDNDRMYLNLTTMGRYYIRSPFHAIFNWIKMRKLKRVSKSFNMIEHYAGFDCHEINHRCKIRQLTFFY